jgi:hypothetical protein
VLVGRGREPLPSTSGKIILKPPGCLTTCLAPTQTTPAAPIFNQAHAIGDCGRALPSLQPGTRPARTRWHESKHRRHRVESSETPLLRCS